MALSEEDQKRICATYEKGQGSITQETLLHDATKHQLYQVDGEAVDNAGNPRKISYVVCDLRKTSAAVLPVFISNGTWYAGLIEEVKPIPMTFCDGRSAVVISTPIGSGKAGMTPIEIAFEETEKETSTPAKGLYYAGRGYPGPATDGVQHYMFVALTQNLKPNVMAGNSHYNESTRVKVYSLDQLRDLADNFKIDHMTSANLVNYYLRNSDKINQSLLAAQRQNPQKSGWVLNHSL